MTFNRKSTVLIFIVCTLLTSLGGFSQIETEENELEIETGIITDDIVNVVRVSGSPIAVITGGEPLMHNLNGLTTKLKSIGVRTHIETSGAHPLSGSWDWICFAPFRLKIEKAIGGN